MKVITILTTLMLSLPLLVHSIFADVGNTFSGGGGGGGDYSFDSSTGGEPATLVEAVIIIIVSVIFLFLLGLVAHLIDKANKKKQTQVEQVLVQQLQTRDEAFSPQTFKDYVREVFLQVQDAWESRDMSAVRPFETDELFHRHQQQLQEFIQKDWMPHLDQQQVYEVYIAEVYQEASFEYVIIRLSASVVDYTTDAKGKVVQGDKGERQFRTYRLTFKRHLSVLTQPNEFLSTKTCPSCGSPTQVGEAGQCEFCGSVVTTGEHNWVLENYEAWE